MVNRLKVLEITGKKKMQSPARDGLGGGVGEGRARVREQKKARLAPGVI